MLERSVSWIVLVYGALLAAFGLLGYVKGGSLISLFIGGISGFLLILCAWAMFARHRRGADYALILTFLLTGLFIYRYSVNGKSVTALLACISGAVLLYLLTHAFQKRRRK